MQIVFTPDTLFILGISLVLAYFGAEIMQKIGIPRILGFMIAGLGLGMIGVVDETVRATLFPLVDLALGLIGYNIGLEIRKEVFSGQARRLSVILVAESILTFVVVTFLAWMLLGAWHIAIVFGALASATDPASTVMVIWERKTKGNLTDSLMFILALDDVIAIILANAAISLAVLYYAAPGTITILAVVLTLAFDLVASSAAGAILGFVMVYFVNREDSRKQILEFEFGMIILLVGLMSWLNLSTILSCMVFGFIVGNWVSPDKDPVSHTLKILMSPIVMIFFVIVGASINLSFIAELSIILLAGVYIIGRTFSKYFGARVGATLTNTPSLTSKYLGLCLMSQAGVAVGLSLVVEKSFLTIGAAEAISYGVLILNVIALTTMVLQVFGPIAASEGLKRAGEYPTDIIIVPVDGLFSRDNEFSSLQSSQITGFDIDEMEDAESEDNQDS